MKIKVGYKVFNGKKVLRPATSSALQSIRYIVNRWTEQNPNEYGPFAVFKTLEDAKRFRESFGTQIRKVEYIESDEHSLWKKNPPSFLRNSYRKGYYAKSNGKSEMYINKCPENTVLAKEIYVYPEIIE